MTEESLLGLPLAQAVCRLRQQGIEPAIEQSCAPRRPQGGGAVRVVRVLQGGHKLTVCDFYEPIKSAEEASYGGEL